MTAGTELRQGRRDAQSVVIVVTDGRPMSPEMTEEASLKIRKMARLVWVPVTKFISMDDVKQWASTPARENVLQVADFPTLAQPDTLSQIISDVCPQVSSQGDNADNDK